MSIEEEWSTAVSTIERWQQRARVASNGHRLALKKSADRHRRWGLVLVLLSTLLASSFLGRIETFIPDHPKRIEFVRLVLALSVALISAYQAHAAADQAAQKHDSLRAEYSAVCRDIEATLALPASQRGSVSEFLKRIGDKLDALSHSNFHIPEREYALAEAREKSGKVP